MTSITTETRKRTGKEQLLAFGGAALALVVAAGIGAWQVVREDGETTTSEQSQTVTVAPFRPQAAAPVYNTTTVYLMSSDEEAVQLTSYWDGLAAQGFALPRTASELVVAVHSAEEAAWVLRLPALAQQYPEAGTVRVVDMRTH